MKSNAPSLQERRRWLLVFPLIGLIGGVFLISTFIAVAGNGKLFCHPVAGDGHQPTTRHSTPAIEFDAILHYATSRAIPQQSLPEIRITFDVLRSLSPCNFLMFGLGHDSLMWASLNPRGTTLFLEEDPKWIRDVLKDAPTLHVRSVQYRTKLSQADDLLSSYQSEPDCSPARAVLRSNTGCKLALSGLPDEVYDREWELIMIDAPRGYYPDAPGRMGAIYSAAVMARRRKVSGAMHVFLHDVNRRVEKFYAMEFLCRSNLKEPRKTSRKIINIY